MLCNRLAQNDSAQMFNITQLEQAPCTVHKKFMHKQTWPTWILYNKQARINDNDQWSKALKAWPWNHLADVFLCIFTWNVCQRLTQMWLRSAFHYLQVAFVKYMGKSSGPESCGVAIAILFKIQCKQLAKFIG